MKELIEAGHRVWSGCYRQGDSNKTAYHKIFRSWLANGPSGEQLTTNDLYSTLALGRWVDGACRTLRPVSDEFFAALALTDISKNAYEDLRFPWTSFGIEIPPDLLVDEVGGSYRFAVVSSLPQTPRLRATQAVFDRPDYNEEAFFEVDLGTICLYRDDENLSALQEWSDRGIGSLLFDSNPDCPVAPGDATHPNRSAVEVRLQEMAKQAIVGLLYTLQHTKNWSYDKRTISKLKNDPRFGPPDHRVMVVGKPITVDVRDAVREYVAHGHASPAIQSLVRGHQKRQVVGAGRASRKVIWIEPYWRGPKDAPIAARPYTVGSSHEDGQVTNGPSTRS